jgi:hypothetical protein
MSDQNIFQGPPNWCKNAIATSQGWANSITGELLLQVGGNFKKRSEYLTFFPENTLNARDGTPLTLRDGSSLLLRTS